MQDNLIKIPGPKNGKTKMDFYTRMLKNGSIYSCAMRGGKIMKIKPEEVDKFCDDAISQIETLRIEWKKD